MKLLKIDEHAFINVEKIISLKVERIEMTNENRRNYYEDYIFLFTLDFADYYSGRTNKYQLGPLSKWGRLENFVKWFQAELQTEKEIITIK
ncbi:hypothetical protein FACS189437_03330 [Bacteroidia bacterium]|nr:hypothetical protein FACS189437_03330 [Bacteroidia bacterium]